LNALLTGILGDIHTGIETIAQILQLVSVILLPVLHNLAIFKASLMSLLPDFQTDEAT